MRLASATRKPTRRVFGCTGSLHGTFPAATPGRCSFILRFRCASSTAEGARLRDADGHEYVDFLSEYTAGVYGHSHPVIRRAVEEALAFGLNVGGHSPLELRFAEAVRARMPNLELVRFTNSGTEANLMALVAARAFTRRQKVMVFAGAYHGAVLYFRHPEAIRIR